jgi:hypothetical protein
MIWVAFALGVGVVVLFAVHALMHSWIRDLQAQQGIILDQCISLRDDLEKLQSQADELQRNLDYGRRARQEGKRAVGEALGMVEEQP